MSLQAQFAWLKHRRCMGAYLYQRHEFTVDSRGSMKDLI